MKKQTLLFMAGGLMAIASCNSNTGDTGMTQATIDSTVNARVEEIRTEMMRQNDSLINVMATMKADSMIAAMKGGKVAVKAPVKTTHQVSNTTVVEESKPDNTKTSTRPGATNQNGTKTTDRPGATNQNGTKTTDRPGSTNNH